jgi:hypothetical protein
MELSKDRKPSPEKVVALSNTKWLFFKPTHEPSFYREHFRMKPGEAYGSGQ